MRYCLTSQHLKKKKICPIKHYHTIRFIYSHLEEPSLIHYFNVAIQLKSETKPQGELTVYCWYWAEICYRLIFLEP